MVSASEGKELLGLAPLFIHDNRTIMLLGSKEICDYLDLIVKPENLRSFVMELADFLSSPSFPKWDQMILHNLMQSSETIGILKETAQKRNWELSMDCHKQSPFILLPGNWDDYLLSIDKKQRHEIRRKMRRAEEKPDLRWYFIEDHHHLGDAINNFLNLMGKDEEKLKFLTPHMREHMRAVMQWAFENKILQLSFLEIGGQRAAAYYCFNYQNKILVYNSGFDPDYSEFSPGWVLLGYLLKWANENGISEFDFMRGNEDYKYRFGGKDRFVVCVNIHKKDH
jgi:CelD/BcsL family acetyltransferase involved in cellulose biosynthesis